MNKCDKFIIGLKTNQIGAKNIAIIKIEIFNIKINVKCYNLF